MPTRAPMPGSGRSTVSPLVIGMPRASNRSLAVSGAVVSIKSAGVSSNPLSRAPVATRRTRPSKNTRRSSGGMREKWSRYTLSLIPSKCSTLSAVRSPAALSVAVVSMRIRFSVAGVIGEVFSVSPSGVATR